MESLAKPTVGQRYRHNQALPGQEKAKPFINFKAYYQPIKKLETTQMLAN
jgi:hypothetical protein